MALSALHPYAQKELSHIFQLLFRVFDSFVPGDRRIGDHGPGSSQKFADHFVVRFIREQAVADPRVERKV